MCGVTYYYEYVTNTRVHSFLKHAQTTGMCVLRKCVTSWFELVSTQVDQVSVAVSYYLLSSTTPVNIAVTRLSNESET